MSARGIVLPRWRRGGAGRPAELLRIAVRPRRHRSSLRRTLALGTVGFVVLSLLMVPVAYGSWTQTLGVVASVQTAACRIAAAVKISPQTLNGGSSGQPVTATIAFPTGATVTVAQIDPAHVTMKVRGTTATISALPSPSTLDGGHLTVAFRRADVVGLLAGRSGAVTLVVSGPAGSCTFSGADTIDYAPAQADTTTAAAVAAASATSTPAPATPAVSASATPTATTAGTADPRTSAVPAATPEMTGTPTAAAAATPASTPAATPAAPVAPATPTSTPTPSASTTPGSDAGSNAAPPPTATPVAAPEVTPEVTPTPAPTTTPAATPAAAPEPATVGAPVTAATPATTSPVVVATPVTTPPAPATTPVSLPAPLPTPTPAPPVTTVARLVARFGQAGTVCGQLWLGSQDPADAGQTVVLRLESRALQASDWSPTDATASVVLVAGQLRYDACLTIPDALRAAAAPVLLRLAVDAGSTAKFGGPIPSSEPLPWIPALAPAPAATPAATPASGGPPAGAETPPSQP